jgi:uncharacterized protein YdiU (UPF0061 family)
MIAHWNLRALALALSELMPTDTLLDRLATFEEHFGAKYRALMRAKLGLVESRDGDDKLIGELLALMAKARADYPLTFRKLNGEDRDWIALFGDKGADAEAWLSRYRVRTEGDDLSRLDRVNPLYVLRNWVAETAIRAVEDQGDIVTLDRIFRLVQQPFTQQKGGEAFASPPPAELSHLEVSCSS